MLDIKFIRENPDLIREAARKKHIEFDLDRLLKLDQKRRDLITEVDAIRAEHKIASENIAQMPEGAEREAAIEKVKLSKETLTSKEKSLNKVEEEYGNIILLVPNIPDLSVPEGTSDADNVQVEVWGEIPTYDFEPKDHITLMKELDLVDFERGTKVAGFRGYFLKNEAVLLEFALWQLAIELLLAKGFTLMHAPALTFSANLYGTGYLPQAKDEVYKLDEDLYLAGTSEVPVMGMYRDEILEESDLPKKFVSISPCYRSEAGSYGKDTKGLYRVHEFMKVEQVVLTKASHEESVTLHEELTANSEALLQALKLPYRKVINCGGDIGLGQVKKYDLEAWIPSQQKYGETHSSSYFHDFQTRRLKIRYKDKEGNIKFAHSLNDTMVATPRILIQILENYQEADGSVKVPEVLQKWVGKERITKQGA